MIRGHSRGARVSRRFVASPAMGAPARRRLSLVTLAGTVIAGVYFVVSSARPKNVVHKAMSSAREVGDSGSQPSEPWPPLRAGAAHASIVGRGHDEPSPVAVASAPTRLHEISSAAGAAACASEISRDAIAARASQHVAVGNSAEAAQRLEPGSSASRSIGETPRFHALSDRWDQEADAPLDVAATQETQKYLLETARALELKDETVSSAECRTTVCRARLRFPTLQAAASFEQGAQQPDLEYELKNKPSKRGVIEVEVLLTNRGQP